MHSSSVWHRPLNFSFGGFEKDSRVFPQASHVLASVLQTKGITLSGGIFKVPLNHVLASVLQTKGITLSGGTFKVPVNHANISQYKKVCHNITSPTHELQVTLELVSLCFCSVCCNFIPQMYCTNDLDNKCGNLCEMSDERSLKCSFPRRYFQTLIAYSQARKSAHAPFTFSTFYYVTDIFYNRLSTFFFSKLYTK